MVVTKRELGGRITRAKTVHVWVPYATMGEEEIGMWLRVPKVVAREIVIDAGDLDEGAEINVNDASDHAGGHDLFIGPGPDPF